MTKQLEALIAEAKLSASIMELISSFEPQDIDGDDVDLRFEVDGFDTGCNVSLVEQCGKASEQLAALISALEQSQKSGASNIPVKYKGAEIISRDGLELIRDGITEATALESMCMAAAILQGGGSPLAVKLPESFYPDGDIECPKVMNEYEVIEAIRAAGGQVEGE